LPELSLYEVPDFAKRTSGIILADDIPTARAHIAKMLDSGRLADSMSADNRALAVELFGHETIKKQWKDFLL
jgi:hypothetical protein